MRRVGGERRRGKENKDTRKRADRFLSSPLHFFIAGIESLQSIVPRSVT